MTEFEYAEKMSKKKFLTLTTFKKNFEKYKNNKEILSSTKFRPNAEDRRTYRTTID